MFTYCTYKRVRVYVKHDLNFENYKTVQKHTHIYLHIPHMPQNRHTHNFYVYLYKTIYSLKH